MTSIRILKNTVCGGQVVRSGQIVEASDTDAKILIGSGKAEIAKASPQPVVEKEPEVTIEPKRKRGRPRG